MKISHQMTNRPINAYTHYHAHVYFDETSVKHASSICLKAGELFDVKVGQIHEKFVGPHPCWSCQLTFDNVQFDDLLSWLEQHRQGLTILVHALTGDDLKDHTEHASWLGEPVQLNLSVFEKSP